MFILLLSLHDISILYIFLPFGEISAPLGLLLVFLIYAKGLPYNIRLILFNKISSSFWSKINTDFI